MRSTRSGCSSAATATRTTRPWPGRHCAKVLEESGIPGLRLLGSQPAQLSTHEVRCGPIRPSHHLDVRYVAVAPPGAEPVVSVESLEVRWFDVGALPDGLEPELHELISIARRT